MRSHHRLAALIFVWLVFAVLASFIVTGPMMDSSLMILGSVYAVTALAATLLIARIPSVEDVPARPVQTSQGSHKAKRGEAQLVDRLIDTLSDDELARLRERLLVEPEAADDGEVVSLEELIERRRGNEGG